MYLGRIVAIGMNQKGRATALYRVSSRSFPNREAVLNDLGVAVVPRAGFESDLRKNPYISYNAARIAGDYAVVSNGSHTDPIAEKIAAGMPVRDAFALGLLAMDFEKDSLDTPRIVGAVNRDGTRGFLGIVRKDALLVRELHLEPGKLFYISTYEHNAPCHGQFDPKFDAATPENAVQYAINGGIFADFEFPVTATAMMTDETGDFKFAVLSV